MPFEGFLDLVNHDRDWQESGLRLLQILRDLKEQVGEAPMRITEDGKVLLHSDAERILNEPANAGPLEFLRCIERTGIVKGMIAAADPPHSSGTAAFSSVSITIRTSSPDS